MCFFTLTKSETLVTNGMHAFVSRTSYLFLFLKYFLNVSDVLQGEREQGTTNERETGSPLSSAE